MGMQSAFVSTLLFEPQMQVAITNREISMHSIDSIRIGLERLSYHLFNKRLHGAKLITTGLETPDAKRIALARKNRF